jgi:uncharacterized delta-60 repeat protein
MTEWKIPRLNENRYVKGILMSKRKTGSLIIASTFLILFLWLLMRPVGAQVNIDWVNRYDGPISGIDGASGMAIDASNNIYVCGYSQGDGTLLDYTVIKYYPDGDMAWLRRHNGPANMDDYPNAIAVDDFGNAYVTGRSYNNALGESDCFTVKYNSDGDTVWARTYNGPDGDSDWGNALVTDASGNVYVTGASFGNGTSSNYITIKYNSNGDMEWATGYNGPANGIDEANAAALNNSDNSILVTGFSDGGGTTGYDYATIKYSSNGDSVWAVRYNGPGSGDDKASCITVDDAGNVFVTGGSASLSSNIDYETIGYFPDGQEAWISSYDGLVSGVDSARAITADNNFVYVTGISYDSLAGDDWVTIKYNKSDGDTVWVRRYNGENSIDWPYDMVVDGSGNVYITGFSFSFENFHNYNTIRYNPDGSTAWLESYNGPGNIDDVAVAIALDENNNIYVSGISIGDGTSWDFATLKYEQLASGIADEGGNPQHPANIDLLQNYPNPFNLMTTINYSLAKPSHVRLEVYNILGQREEILVDENKDAGSYTHIWQAINFPSGIYFYRILAGDFEETRKMLFLK